MVSLLRDSYVTIPGHDKSKINAAFAIGGPQLLVRTVEANTGLRIDHYAQIGLGGFVNVVGDVGGVPNSSSSTTTANRGRARIGAYDPAGARCGSK